MCVLHTCLHIYFWADPEKAGVGIILYCRETVVVSRVVAGSAAALNAFVAQKQLPNAGIEPGDQILEIGGVPVS